jgi:hypothetical protein
LATQRRAAASSSDAVATATVMALSIPVPRPPALIMAALSIISNEWLFRITKTVGESLNSQVVIANAWHHRSDAYSSVLALVSIGLAITVPGMVAADLHDGGRYIGREYQTIAYVPIRDIFRTKFWIVQASTLSFCHNVRLDVRSTHCTWHHAEHARKGGRVARLFIS